MDAVDGGEWARRNGLTKPVPFSHNLSKIFPPALFDTHPEYFLERDGVRVRPQDDVVSWNPDLGNPAVAVHAAAAARAYFDQNPDAVSFPVGVNDGLRFGESAATLRWIEPDRWFRGRPDYSNLVYQFTNRVAAEVRVTHPDKLIGALAYYWCEQAPDFPLEPNVLPFLTADRSQGYSTEFRREERALQGAWAAKGTTRLGLYDYIYGSGFLIPRIHTKLLADNLRAARRLGFTDYYAEMYPNWGLDGPQPWLVAQLLQDPNASRRRLLDEYYRRYFREAAAPMRAFFERCEEQWMSQEGEAYWLKHWRNPSQASLFPSDVCGSLRGLLDEAARRARNPVVKARVDLAGDSFAITERLAALVETRTALTVATLKNEPSREELLKRWIEARARFMDTLTTLRAEHPAALFSGGVTDFVTDDPTYAALRLRAGGTGEHEDVAGLTADLRAGAAMKAAMEFERAERAGQVRELLIDGGFEGPLKPPGKMAGLVYEMPITQRWMSSTEPAERERSGVRSGANRSGERGLRIEGAIASNALQWRSITPGQTVEASAWVRGHVGISTRVQFVLGWLDERGTLMVREHSSLVLPEGDWPEWVQLRQGRVAPDGAKWVGVGLLVKQQGRDDWVEWDDVSLRSTLGSSE